MRVPPGCYMFEGKVSSPVPSKLPVPEKGLYEVRVHSKRLYGSPMYYIEDLSPSAILAKVEDNQEEVRRLVKEITEDAKVVGKLVEILELVRQT